MNWVFFAILSPLLFTVSNFIDKFLTENVFRDYRVIAVISASGAAFASTLAWFAMGFPGLNLFDALLTLGIGAGTVIAVWFYFKGIAAEETSIVVVLLQMQPLFVLPMAYIFLGERLTNLQMLGFFLIMFASLGISLSQGFSLAGLSGAFAPMLVVTLFGASQAIILKNVIDNNSLAQTFVFEGWGFGLGALVWFVQSADLRRSVGQALVYAPRQSLGLCVFNEFGIVILAKFALMAALVGGDATLVKVIGSTQVFIGILMGYTLTVILPAIYHENISTRMLLRKSSFGLLMMLGIWLIG